MFHEYLKSSYSGMVLVLLLACTSVSAETRYYPTANPTPLAVGSEEYSDNYASLGGLEGVHVVAKHVFSAAKKFKLNDMKTDLMPEIRKRFDAAGLRMLTEQEVKKTPGQPTLSLFPAYSGGEIDEIKAKTNAKPDDASKEMDETDPNCCRSSIWASFQQSASILRDPNTTYQFSTWGSGEDSASCENRGAWTYDAALKSIDKFLKDYKQAETERTPKLVTTASEVPENCAQAWLMNLSVFETNKIEVNDSVKPILDVLAETADRCKKYNYVIETHADKRADEAYNKVLSEARAHAIKDYLLSKNVQYNRLKTYSFGETRPLTNGNSEQDHAINRRVVIIPRRG